MLNRSDSLSSLKRFTRSSVCWSCKSDNIAETEQPDDDFIVNKDDNIEEFCVGSKHSADVD